MAPKFHNWVQRLVISPKIALISPENEVARKLFIILRVAVPVLLLALILSNTFFYIQKLGPTVLAVANLIACGAAYYLAVRGNARAGAWLLLASTWIVITIGAWCAGGLLSVVPTYYLVLNAAAGWILGRRGLVWLTGMTCTALVIMLVVDTAGPGLPHYFSVPPASAFLVFVICLALSTIPALQVLRSLDALRSAEERHRALFTSLREAVFVADAQTGRIVDANRAAETLVGRSLTELRGLHHSKLHPSEWAAIARREFAKKVRQPGVIEGEVVHQDGRRIAVEIANTIWTAADGTLLVFGLFRDISERKRAEAELRASEQRFRALAESSPVGVHISYNDKLAYVNPALAKMLGFDAGEITGKKFLDLIEPEDHALVREMVRRLAGEVKFVHYQYRCKSKDGSTKHVEIHGTCADIDGKRALLGTIIDVTARMQTEAALRDSEEKFRATFMSSADAFIITVFEDGRIIDVNKAFEELFGYTRQEITGKTVLDLRIYDDPADRASILARVKTEGRVVDFELTLRKQSGEGFLASVWSVPFMLGGRPHLVAAMRDITERKRAAEALRRSEAKFAALFRCSPASVTLSDLNDGDRFLEVNEAFERFTGHPRETVIGHRRDGLWLDRQEYAQAVSEFTRDGRLSNFEFRFRRSNGEIRTGMLSAEIIDLDGRPCVLTITIDITERKQAEAEHRKLWAQLAQAQKMESVGQLAGGVAHDFNNLMGVILLHADSAPQDLSNADAITESIKAVKEAAEKAVVISRQLMALSHNQVARPEVLNLSSVISESEKFLRRLIGEHINLVCKRGPALKLVKADVGYLNQVIMNLAVNSRDAMPHGGSLTIETANVQIDEDEARRNPEARPAPYVMLSVRDTGTGMDSKTLSRVFEPFFTTKEVGRGTGLGLSVVYGIVKQSGGFITVTSEVGQGAEFRVYLPVTHDYLKPAVNGREAPLSRGFERVLLAEDEPALRNKVSELLNHAGYEVLAAPDGEEAFQMGLRDSRPLHILLTDVVMPGQSGPRLAQRLQNLHPEMKVLYMSGYPDAGEANSLLLSQRNFIEKPFTQDQLLRRMREVLEH